MTDETPSRLPQWEKGVIAVVLLLAVIGGLPALGWLWLSDPDRVREDLASRAGVGEVTDLDGLPQVLLEPDVTTDEIASVLDEAERYGDALDEADDGRTVVVRLGDSFALVGPGRERVDAALLGATGAWPTRGALTLQLSHGAQGAEITATGEARASVSTLDWLVQQTTGLDHELEASVGWLNATNEPTAKTSRVLGDAARDLPASEALVTALAGLAGLDPQVIVATPEVASVHIVTGADQVAKAERRAARVLRDYPRVQVHVSPR